MSLVIAALPLREGQARLLRILLALGLLVLAALALPGSTEAASFNEVKKLLASDAGGGDYFGESVAVSGNTAVVGANRESAGGSAAGAAYVFQRDEGGTGNWGEVKKLTASDAQTLDNFGISVAVSGDTAVVGAYLKASQAGAAYVFQRDEGGVDNWGEVKKLTASDAVLGAFFGFSVAINGDIVVVGANSEGSVPSNAGAAYVFQRNEGGADNWGELTKLTASDAQAFDQFGWSVAVSGDTAVVGAFGEDTGGFMAGASYVFQRNQGGADNWGEAKKLTASDAQAFDFFASVALSGDTAVVGADGEDAGGSRAGAAYVFHRNEGGADNWGEVKKLTASGAQEDDRFGHRVAAIGDTAVVGAYREASGGFQAGAAYIFQRNQGGAGNWGEVKKLTASDAQAEDRFGFSVAVSGDAALMGAHLEDAGGSDAGAAYVFDLLQPKPVGGISLDSDLRALPLETSGASDGSYGVVSQSIAIGAAVVLLAGIAWCATRRWLR